MNSSKELDDFLTNWQEDSLNLKPSFLEMRTFLSAKPDIEFDFKARPGVSYSLRAKHKNQKNRDLFTLIDVVDDEPKARWLSVCFYADMVTDPEERGDFVPQGLFGENAICFNLDEDNADVRDYILKRLEEAATKAA